MVLLTVYDKAGFLGVANCQAPLAEYSRGLTTGARLQYRTKLAIFKNGLFGIVRLRPKGWPLLPRVDPNQGKCGDNRRRMRRILRFWQFPTH
jgi:hypothetical protein